MKMGKIDRKMHKIKEYSLRELLFIPNNHFISQIFNISVNKLNFLTAKKGLYVHINYFEFAYSDDKSDLYLFSAQCYIMVHMDSMKYLIRLIFMFLFLILLSLTLPLISLQLMLISSFV